MKTGNKEANLERLNDNPYRLNRLVMFPNMTQQQFVDHVVPPGKSGSQLSRQMLRNVELGLPTVPPENLTFILSHHSSTSLYYQDPDRLLEDYKAFQRHTRHATGLVFGDTYSTDVDFRWLEHAPLPSEPNNPFPNRKPRTLSTMHYCNITNLASKLCYPLQQLQRLNDDSRPSAVGDSFKRVLRDLGYNDAWINQLTRNHEVAIELHKSSKKIGWSFN